jgi:hypothetical protein
MMNQLLPLLSVLSLPVLASLGHAQVPAPNPSQRVAPRAHWVQTPGVTGTFSQRRDNHGAASETHLYVFGGRVGNASSGVLNALYSFDGKAWKLETAEGAAGSPPKRGGAAVTWDFSRNKLVVFGGDQGSSTTLLNDTWEWDPTTKAWTQVNSTNAPSPRRWSAIAYDPLSKGIVLFGGQTAAGFDGETWVLLGGQWTQRTITNAPPARSNHSMVTRRNFGDIVLFGGQDNTNGAIRHLELYRWVGATWIKMSTNGTVPHSTVGNHAVYDEARKRIIVQGGNGISTYGGSANYGTLYGGSPSTWASEFDCISNQWRLYGASSFSTADPVIGRVSRYFTGYIHSIGKVYKVSGQNPSGTGTITGTCEYQAAPLASADALGTACGTLALAGDFPNDRPFLGASFDSECTGLATGSVALGLIGFTTLNVPLMAISPVGGNCSLRSGLDLVLPLVGSGGSAQMSLPLPNDPSFAGAMLYQQVLELKFGGGMMTSLEASNGLTLTLGVN